MDANLIVAFVQLAGFVIGGIVIAVTMRNNVSALQNEVADLKSEFREDVDRLAGALTTIAIQHERLERIERQYDELRRGEGFIFPLARSLRGES